MYNSNLKIKFRQELNDENKITDYSTFSDFYSRLQR